ncbi:MAG: hypothetical protein U5K38_16605 [Woeseiaceae bacterium]|nr:hypothetical protein [Woeseiaceae bacterium]
MIRQRSVLALFLILAGTAAADDLLDVREIHTTMPDGVRPRR